MNRNKQKFMIWSGVICVLSLIISCWYAVTYNESRLVVPMDFSNYIFQVKDLPMILSVSFTCIYCIALFLMLFSAQKKKQRIAEQTNITRKLNPKFGLLGFLGFAGLLGIWTYQISKETFPFIFFTFFGFFGFFFEGKMSDTLVDERYAENRKNAQFKAYHIGYSLTFITLIASSWSWLFPSNDIKLLFITVSLSLTYGLVIFLSEYLLYRYDNNDNIEE